MVASPEKMRASPIIVRRLKPKIEVSFQKLGPKTPERTEMIVRSTIPSLGAFTMGRLSDPIA